MPSQTTLVKVLIASPGDVVRSRDVVEATLHDWNRERAADANTILLPRRWETDSVPVLGYGDGQQVINAQLVADADILVGIFHTRLGSPTPRAVSGTAEEIYQLIDVGKPVHVFFSEEPVPHDVDLKRLEELRRFKKELAQRGLLGRFDSPADLSTKVRHAISLDLGSSRLGNPSTTWSEESVARVSVRYQHTDLSRYTLVDDDTELYQDRIEVRNDPGSTRSVKNVTVTFGLAPQNSLAPSLRGTPSLSPGRPVTLAPGETYTWPIEVPATIDSWDTVVSWDEAGKPRSLQQRVFRQ